MKNWLSRLRFYLSWFLISTLISFISHANEYNDASQLNVSESEFNDLWSIAVDLKSEFTKKQLNLSGLLSLKPKIFVCNVDEKSIQNGNDYTEAFIEKFGPDMSVHEAVTKTRCTKCGASVRAGSQIIYVAVSYTHLTLPTNREV